MAKKKETATTKPAKGANHDTNRPTEQEQPGQDSPDKNSSGASGSGNGSADGNTEGGGQHDGESSDRSFSPTGHDKSDKPRIVAAGQAKLPSGEPAQPDKPRRRRRTKREIESERAAAAAAAAKAAQEQTERALRVLIDGVAVPLGILLPPPLEDQERAVLAQAWAPVVVEHGDLPPWLAATVVTVAILTPRILAKFHIQ